MIAGRSNAPNPTDKFLLFVLADDVNNVWQIAHSVTGNMTVWVRRKLVGVWESWYKLIQSQV